MVTTRFDRYASALILAVVVCVPLTPSVGQCDDNEAIVSGTSSGSARESETGAETPLRFSFEGVAWRDVIRWIADEADLALQFGELPTGSFTYSDPSEYSHQDAIDRINLFLLPQGFTLVRSGKLLSVINLGDPRSIQQLDALADLVSVAQLVEQENHEVIKCIFPLGELSAEDAVQELSALNLMTTPAVFSKTNQLMITDTAGKLKNVKQILDAFQPSQMDNGTVVKSFALKHVDAEDVLVVARPHLGLATGEMIGIDVSLSADLVGKNIFVTGVEDKVKLIEGLVEAIDRPDSIAASDSDPAVLRSHFVEGGNVEIVYNVLQTLLAGKSVRLSMDETAGSIVALATPSVQTEIEATVTQLQAADADFEVIPLKTVDPYLAISLLEQMLDLPDEFADSEEIDPDAPKIDADPANMRLFVRAKKYQIEQIKKIVAGLDSGGSVAGEDLMRIFPLQGSSAAAILEAAARFWRGDNPVILYRSTIDSQAEISERVVGVKSDGQTLTAKSTGDDADLRNQRMLTVNAGGKGPAIRCQLTSRGVLLQSDDPTALDKFEEHLRTIIGPTDTLPSPPVVFYLKYTKPDDALRLLAELMDGGQSVSELSGAALVNGYVSSGIDSFLGSIVTSRDGTSTMLAGSITVVADSRLNRLIAQGTESDIARIEGYLSIIDKDNSITEIETYGSSHVIELYNSRASEVAASLRDAFAGRVAAASGTGQPGVPGSPQAQQAAAAAKAAEAKREPDADGKKQTDKKTAASRPAKDLEPKMTIAVHEPSNSLIVTAPDQLFEEVEKLARSIDSRGEQAVEVIAPLNGELIELVLQQVLLGESSSSRRPPLSSSSSRSSSSSSSRNKVDR